MCVRFIDLVNIPINYVIQHHTAHHQQFYPNAHRDEMQGIQFTIYRILVQFVFNYQEQGNKREQSQ